MAHVISFRLPPCKQSAFDFPLQKQVSVCETGQLVHRNAQRVSQIGLLKNKRLFSFVPMLVLNFILSIPYFLAFMC
jgi:hypothetical protein